MAVNARTMLLFMAKTTSVARVQRRILRDPSGTVSIALPAQKAWAANTSTVRGASPSVLMTNRSKTETRYAGLAWTTTLLHRS